MTGEKIAGALGLCRRAGKITVGAFLVKEEIRRNQEGIVLLAEDAKANTEKKILPAASLAGIPCHRIVLTKKELGECMGKDGEVPCVFVPREFVNLVLASL